MGCAQVEKTWPLATFSCQAQATQQEICVLNSDEEIVAVNSSDKFVAIELRVNHINNVQLEYRYPFVEFLAPHSSKTLLSYQRRKANRPFALDYDWNWRIAQD